MRLLAVSLTAFCACSCASSNTWNQWSGLTRPATIASSAWSFDGAAGQTLRTPHYLIHTTISDYAFDHTFAQVMEGAYAQYCKLVPGVRLSDQPLQCFVFANRPQWEKFTIAHTGARAETYLQIRRGAFTLRDWYVSYFLGELNSFSIASHEGFHQFVGRNFASRLPPALEEGIACMLENVRIHDGLPQWNLRTNLHRAESLRKAENGGYGFTLQKLLQMNAGDVLPERGQRIEAFYAQSWALAEFLCFGDGGKYHAAFTKLLNDTARGTSQPPRSPSQLLEHYLNLPFKQIEGQYQAFAHKIAFTDFTKQWHP